MMPAESIGIAETGQSWFESLNAMISVYALSYRSKLGFKLLSLAWETDSSAKRTIPDKTWKRVSSALSLSGGVALVAAAAAGGDGGIVLHTVVRCGTTWGLRQCEGGGAPRSRRPQ